MTINRKNFLKASALSGLSVALADLSAFASPKPTTTMNTNMQNDPVAAPAGKPGFQLLILATNWGFDGDSLAFCKAAKKEGYDGVELWWPTETKDQDALAAALQQTGLKVGFLCGASLTNPEEHFLSFRKQVEAATSHAVLKPLYINCHSGRDHFPEPVNHKFISYTTERSAATGVPIYHETHRSRIMFAAHIARKYMEAHASLKLTFDVSHWCNVHESLLADQSETVQLALQRTEHIHARIGHPEGPQVNDPRAPEWKATLQQHLDWWDLVITRKKAAGEQMTILTEFGPPDYMPTEPYTRKPLSDQWAINVYMMQFLRKRYS